VRDDHEPSLHHPASAASVISDVSTALSDDTHDTVAGVSTPFRRHSDDSRVIPKTQSAVEPAGVVELASPDDRSSPQRRADGNRAAIDLLLWKLTELERRITLGQVRIDKQKRDVSFTTNALKTTKRGGITPLGFDAI